MRDMQFRLKSFIPSKNSTNTFVNKYVHNAYKNMNIALHPVVVLFYLAML